MKVCNKCKEEKSLNSFHKNKNKKDGLHSWCKSCVAEYTENNKDIQKERNLDWNSKNPEKRKELQQKDYEKNGDYYRTKSLQYKKDNPEKVKADRIIYNEVYKFEINKKAVARKNLKRKTDPLFKLSSNIRTNVCRSFQRLLEGTFKKSKRTEEILGCLFPKFKQYIESLWEPWMNWDNYGLYNGELNYGWDLDHIIPIGSAKTEEEIYKLNHYTNFQPLCSKINRDIKVDKLTY